jgi:DCN1-like protein 1/2
MFGSGWSFRGKGKSTSSSTSSSSSSSSGTKEMESRGNEQQEKKITSVSEVTGCSRKQAKSFLERTKWSVEAATDAFFESGTVADPDTSPGAGRTRQGSGGTTDANSKETGAKKDQQISKFFETYADIDSSSETITVDGIVKLCEDAEIDPEDPVMLLIAFHCQAKAMFVFTKEEFIRGMNKMNCTSAASLKAAAGGLRNELENNADLFRQVYLFSYNYARDPSQKSLPLETALDLWRVLLPRKFILLPEWLEYVSKNHKHAIMKDEWNQLLDYAKQIPVGSNPKEILKIPTEDSARPMLIDEFTLWYLNPAPTVAASSSTSKTTTTTTSSTSTTVSGGGGKR